MGKAELVTNNELVSVLCGVVVSNGGQEWWPGSAHQAQAIHTGRLKKKGCFAE